MTKGKYFEPEFIDFLKVMELGAEKHGHYNWLVPNGKKSSHKEMHASMFRHLAESSSGRRSDAETGLDPLLHLASRALMMYTRIQRGIYHEEDIKGEDEMLYKALGKLDNVRQWAGDRHVVEELENVYRMLKMHLLGRDV